MPARVATVYDVRWSPRIRMWKSSFKLALFSYGLQIEEMLHDDDKMTIIAKENLPMILTKMKGDLQDHMITDTVSVGSVAMALESILDMSDPSSDEVRLSWE